MPSLCSDAIVSVWPRSVTISHPDVPCVQLPIEHLAEVERLLGACDVVPAELEGALARLLHSEPHDGRLFERLQALDRRYGASLPGLRLDGESVLMAEKLASTRRVWWPIRRARPTLPVSAARRIELIARLGASSFYVEDDIDGLGILLGREGEAYILEPHGQRARWLAKCAEECSVPPHIVADAAGFPPVDVAVIHAGPPADTRDTLARAFRATKPGGHVVICVRAPWDTSLAALLSSAGLEPSLYAREVDHWLLPNSRVADGAGDLLVIERPDSLDLPPADGSPAARTRAHPYATVDIDALAEARLFPGAARELAEAIAARAPRAGALCRMTEVGEREVLCWYDEEGVGLSAELHLEEDHLVVTLMPFDAELEYAVVCAAFETLADDYTRCRPLRTRHWYGENVFG